MAEWIDLTASICIFGAFFLLASELVTDALLDRARRRVIIRSVELVNTLYGFAVLKAFKTTDLPTSIANRGLTIGELTLFVRPIRWNQIKQMLRNWKVILFPSTLILSIGVVLLGILSVAFLWLFNRWATWEHQFRVWVIALGVTAFIYGSVAQITLAAGRVW